jgi:hypothetical protein
MPEKPLTGFNVFGVRDEIQVSRAGTNVGVKTADGSFTQSNSVEANLLYEILKALRSKK